MTDHEIHNCIDAKNEKVIGQMNTIMVTFSKAITGLIVEENKLIKHSIDQLTDRVDKQNGRVGKSEDKITELEKWQYRHQGFAEGKTTQWEKNWRVWLGIIALTGTLSGIFFSMQKIVSTQKELKTQINYINTPIENERGEIVLYPSGMVVDSLSKESKKRWK